MNSSVNKIIFECVDKAFYQLGFINKPAFYRLFEESYGVKPENIGSNYEQFHIAIKNQFGAKHFTIERLALKIMKERTKKGVYLATDEISAFKIITDSIIKDTKDNLSRRRYENLQSYAKILKKKVEEQDRRLEDAARMVAIGETAAMVGHDIRNPLQAISGDLYLVQEDLKKLKGNKVNILESLDSINENLCYINKIVADLQDYARPLNPDIRSTDVNKIINGVLASVFVPEKTTLELEVKTNSEIKTDALFLRRALTNLITNAIQAMPNGGKLVLCVCESGKNLIFIISDTGNGIPEEVKQRMFKPLVTTKSKGQGLGLAVVKRLVEALKGKISFESEVGKGTKFIIELPVNG